MMNGYKAFYRGRQTDVYAETSHAAQKQAAALFKAKKAYEVTVILCETGTNGSSPAQQVTTSID
jgi:hypothetical protein